MQGLHDLLGRPLSPRELEILQAAAAGHDIKGTAKLLGISYTTVNSHRKNLFLKLGAHTINNAVFLACKAGILLD